jgi:hypothetical protein
MKQQHRKRDAEIFNSIDFQDRNMLSFFADVKEHKAFQYQKRNNQIYNIMKDQFLTGDNAVFEAKADRYAQEKNSKFDDNQRKMHDNRKHKEMAVKLF